MLVLPVEKRLADGGDSLVRLVSVTTATEAIVLTRRKSDWYPSAR
jgi:hypothetical protein